MLTTKTKLFDFGEIKEGIPLNKSFEVENGYKEDIVINSISSSCGCTVPKTKLGTIKSGESFPVSFVLNTKNRRGDVIKTIYIRYTVVGKDEELVFNQKFKTHVFL